MTERTAILAMEALDKDKWATQKSVIEIMNILHNYIPHACHREVEDRLFEVFFINGVELTSNTMRKEYEAWKKLEIEAFMLKPNVLTQP